MVRQQQVRDRRRLRRERALGLLVVGALSLAAAACGDESDDAETVAITVAATATSGAASTTTQAAPLTPIKVDFMAASYSSVTLLPQLAAITLGCFEQQGLEMNLLPPIASSATTVQLLETGDADIVQGGLTGLLAPIAQGRDVVVFGDVAKLTLILQMSDENLAKFKTAGLTPESPIKDRVAALRGLTIGAPARGSSTDLLLRAMLEEYGLDPDKDVTIQPFPDLTGIPPALRAGTIDAAMTSPPQPDGGMWINLAANEVPSFDGTAVTVLATTRAFIEKNHEAVERFAKAQWCGWQALEDDPDAAIAAVKARYFPDIDQALYDAGVELVMPAFEGLIPDPAGFETLLGIYNSAQDKPLTLTFDQVYDKTIAEATKP